MNTGKAAVHQRSGHEISDIGQVNRVIDTPHDEAALAPRPPSINWKVPGRVGGGMPGVGPRFDPQVKDNGYVWWYIDGLSDDGNYGFTVIAFID